MLREAFESILATEILMGVSLVSLLVFFGLLVKAMVRDKAPWLPLLGLILLALGLRVFWINITQPTPQSDFGVYWHYANAFYNGDLTFNELSRHPGIVVLYSFAMALLGPSLVAGWAMNLLFSAMFLLVLFRLTEELFGRKAAWFALGLGAVFPQFVVYNALIATEMPAVTWFLLMIWAVLQTRQGVKHPLLYWAGIGAMLYGSVMIRSSSLLLLMMIPVSLLLTRRDQLKSALKGWAVMAVTAGLLISTWVTHQYLVSGIPKLFFGSELWLAFASQYNHGGATIPLQELPYYPKIHAVTDGTMAGDVRAAKVIEQEALAIIRQDPAKYLLFGFTRLKNTIWTGQAGIVWSTQASKVFPGSPKVIRRLCEVSTQFWRVLLILAPLGLLGLYRPVSPLAHEGQMLVWLFVGSWLGFHFLLACASERYAFQLIPFVVMLISGGLTALGGLLKPKAPSE